MYSVLDSQFHGDLTVIATVYKSNGRENTNLVAISIQQFHRQFVGHSSSTPLPGSMNQPLDGQELLSVGVEANWNLDMYIHVQRHTML